MIIQVGCNLWSGREENAFPVRPRHTVTNGGTTTRRSLRLSYSDLTNCAARLHGCRDRLRGEEALQPPEPGFDHRQRNLSVLIEVAIITSSTFNPRTVTVRDAACKLRLLDQCLDAGVITLRHPASEVH